MKRKLFTLLVLLLSVVIMYGGSGVNAYFFCCDDCRNAGLTAVIEQKCCEIHHEHHSGEVITYYGGHACGEEFDLADVCGVERIQVKWTQSTSEEINLQPVVTELDFCSTLAARQTQYQPVLPIQPEYVNRHSQKPPNLSRKDYSSLLTVLII